MIMAREVASLIATASSSLAITKSVRIPVYVRPNFKEKVPGS